MEHGRVIARWLIVAIVVLAAVLVGRGLFHRPPLGALLALAVLFLVFASLEVQWGGVGVTQTVDFPVALAAILLGGPDLAAVVAAASVFAVTRIPLLPRLFNAAQLVLAAWLAGTAYDLLRRSAGIGRLDVDHVPLVIALVLVAAATYLLVNAVLVVGVVVLTEHVAPRAVLLHDIVPAVLPAFANSMLGLLMAVLWQLAHLGAGALLLVLVPLLVARFGTAAHAAQRTAYDATIQTLIQAVETKDDYTRGHSERVAEASVMLARTRGGMGDDRLRTLRYAGILHDVGKLGLPTKLLQKSGPLTESEYDVVKLHPVRGLEVVRDIGFLHDAVAGIVHHHERLDGTGYPLGLSGVAIPEFARVIAVADAFDSMTSTRAYRAARSVPEALDELRRCSGTHFDPGCVDAMVAAVEREGWRHVGGPDAPAPGSPPGPVPAGHYDDDDPTSEVPVVHPDDGRRDRSSRA